MEFDEESLHNIDNAIEAMDIAGRKRGRFSYGETSLKMKVKVKNPTDQQENGLQKRKIILIIISQDNIDIWDPNVEGLKG